ncbi:MAG: diguanylate cyclase [Bacillota bacterium]|nr:diguanylate cyclase [Bacillota bacterium]
MTLKVLVVDDSKVNTRLLTEILKAEGLEVFSTNNSQKALETARVVNPDLILLDIMMPELDGFTICKLLKATFELQDIPVIMVTAKKDRFDIKHALELGAFDYIKIPFDEIEVVARVKSALRYKEQHDRLKELATRDSLTGLYNHSLLMELFEKELAKGARKGNSLSFAMIDIDHFKAINDSYGHLTGDIVLKEISRILVESTRIGDIIGRYGGEEFGLVLPQVTKEQASVICERIRQNIENYKFSVGNTTIKITSSIGFCLETPDQLVDKRSMIKKADDALYSAKKNGRNIVQFAC